MRGILGQQLDCRYQEHNGCYQASALKMRRTCRMCPNLPACVKGDELRQLHQVLLSSFDQKVSLPILDSIQTVIGVSELGTEAKPDLEIGVPIPENAAFGKWGIQVIEFTNCRGYKTQFYRGQGKFDGVDFEVVAPPTREDRPLRLDGVEIAGFQRA